MARTVNPTGPRVIGVATRVDTREKGYVFLAGEDKQEYFAHRSAFTDAGLFDLLCPGDGVSFRVARTGKGYRAFAIEPARGEEVVRLAALEENRGNR